MQRHLADSDLHFATSMNLAATSPVKVQNTCVHYSSAFSLRIRVGNVLLKLFIVVFHVEMTPPWHCRAMIAAFRQLFLITSWQFQDRHL